MQHKPDHSTATKIIVSMIAIICIIFLIAKIGEIREARNAEIKVNESEIDTAFTKIDTTIREKQKVPTKWNYQNATDEMTNKPIKIASIKANELLNFDFPYDGGVTATFAIRRNGKTLDAYLRISKGQFMDTSSGGTVMIKFDKETAHQYSFVGAADHSSEIIFFNNEAKLLNKVRKAKRMLIAATFFREGNHVMAFDVEGLDF